MQSLLYILYASILVSIDRAFIRAVGKSKRFSGEVFMSATASFLLQLGQLSNGSVKALTASFFNLPKSNYLDGAFRLRRFSHFNYKANALLELPKKSFSQNQDINAFQGGVAREYDRIESDVVKSSAFIEMFKEFKQMAALDDDKPIEVHQMRIISKIDSQTQAAPEGIHQDGCDYLAVFVIERKNVRGGEICVHPAQEQAPIFKHAFDKGEFVVLNDKKFWHSAESLQSISDDLAYMDVFVLTA